MTNLNFKYGGDNAKDLTDFNDVASTPGTIYIKKKNNKKAEMFIDTPTESSTRLQIGGTGDVYVGDPDDEEAKEYQAVINPNGTVLDNIVTSAETGGYIIKVVKTSNPDSYNPSLENFSRNTIVLVVEQ